MSLINEALKKAQKQRTGEAPPLGAMPPIGGEPATRIARRAKPASLSTLFLRLGLGAGGLAAVIAVSVLLLRDKPAAETPSVNPPASVAPAPVAPTPATATPPASATAAAPAPAKTETVFTLPIAPPPAAPKTESPPVATTSPAPVPTAVAETPKAAASTPVPAPPAPPGRLEPRAIAYIDNIRVAGIRASSTDSKVLMNDRVYRVGDMVEHEMGLKLVGITPNSLTFEDERGGRYTRNF